MLRIVLPLLALVASACRSDSDSTKADTGSAAPPESNAEWSDLDEDDGDDGDDDDDDDDGDDKEDTGKEDDGKEDTGKPDTGTGDYAVCGDEVATGAACEGGWEDTLCVDGDGVFWWCDGGEWTSDKER